MEQIIIIAIYVHAFFGGIGLLAGTVSFAVKKGGQVHTLAGKWFSVGMIISSLISMPIACMPGHENTFLFLIAIFTIYMVLAGNRALSFKPRLRKQRADFMDKLISGCMLIFSMIMIGFGIYELIKGENQALLFAFFGTIGLFLSWRDFVFYRQPHQVRSGWLINHVGRIVGAYIASITAFIVTGLKLGTLFFWIAPSILGTLAIVYWVRKIKKGQWAKPNTIAS